jgi:hypothetical protein
MYTSRNVDERDEEYKMLGEKYEVQGHGRQGIADR